MTEAFIKIWPSYKEGEVFERKDDITLVAFTFPTPTKGGTYTFRCWVDNRAIESTIPDKPVV